MNSINTINGVLVAAQSDFASHAEDKTLHLTEEERAAWNAKADALALSGKVDKAELTAHETNVTVHVTQEEREKWNTRNTKGAMVATQDGLDEHTENTAIHITSEERDRWNNTPELDAAGNMALEGELTAAEGINANGGVNIPPSVSPLLTGAISNNELLDYLVDRSMRTSPYVTTVPAIILKDYVDKDNSVGDLYTCPGVGSIGIKCWGASPNYERRIRFSRGEANVFVGTQDGPMHYNEEVVILSAPTLLNISYLTSPGAVAQIGFVDAEGNRFGARLVNKEGVAYYEMFYLAGVGVDEVVTISEPAPAYANLYRGSTEPRYKMQSMAIFKPRDGNQYAIVKYGPWSMRIPFFVHNGFALELLVRQGSNGVNYYGAGLSARIATITHICLDFKDQFVPTLNNETYKS